MSEWKLKRFWTDAAAVEVEGGFTVQLDGRGVKTPAKQGLVVPSRALAQALADEWQTQEGEVNPESMPLTRLSNSALDKVTPQHADVAAMLAEYGANDLLCYRADGPDPLVARQAEQWDPLLTWASAEHGLQFIVQSGIMPVTQPPATCAKLSGMTHALDVFSLTAFHELVMLPGSWIIGYAALTNARDPKALWTLATLDEIWQEEQWGADEEAAEARAAKESAFATAHHFLELSRK